jgi:hypothetical protein
MENILVVAPHPDDETLGCGGTFLKLKISGHRTNWLIVNCIPPPPPRTRILAILIV